MIYIRSLTLNDLCLGSIIEHLDFFIKYKDFIPERHINFLLRLYSKECFTKYSSLNEEHSTTEECLLWFLSSSNKNVFLPNITQSIVEKLQIVGPAITSLNLKEATATESLLNSVLCCVPHLSHLDLSYTTCSNKTLLSIQKMCPDLVTLNIEGCNVTDVGMLYLCESNLALKNLNILGTGVEPMGLVYILRDMPSLQCLVYDNLPEQLYGLYKPVVRPNENFKFNLTELIYKNVLNNPMKVISFLVDLCPNVEKLHIMFPVSHEVLDMCSRFLHLKEFVYQSRKCALEGLFYVDPLTPLLSRAKDITTLKLSYVKIHSVVLLECFENVKHLHLKAVTFTSFTEDEIKSKNTNLDTLIIKDLDLNETGDTYKFIVFLISLSKDVTQLVIRDMKHFPADLVDVILNSMTNLIFIEINYINSKLPLPLFKFFEIPTVQRVYLDGCMDEDGCLDEDGCMDIDGSIDPFFRSVHFSTDSCTLAWHIMNDDLEDDVYSHDDDERVYENSYDKFYFESYFFEDDDEPW